MTRRRSLLGFTLLELLIAIAIFALVGLASYRMLESLLRSDEATRTHEAQLRELTRAFSSLERDLLQVIARPIRDGYGDRRPAFQGESRALDGDTALELTRSGWRNPAGWQRSTLARVRWRLNGEVLERLYWSVLDQAVDSEPRVQRVLEQVSDLELRYLDRNGEWQQDWPPSVTLGYEPEQTLEFLPRAVELRLTHVRYGELRRLLCLPDGAVLESLPAERYLDDEQAAEQDVRR